MVGTRPTPVNFEYPVSRVLQRLTDSRPSATDFPTSVVPTSTSAQVAFDDVKYLMVPAMGVAQVVPARATRVAAAVNFMVSVWLVGNVSKLL